MPEVNQVGAFQDQSRSLLQRPSLVSFAVLLFSIVNVMAIFTIRLNKYFLDTFIEVVEDLTNCNDDEIKDIIDDIDDKIPESRRY